MIPIFRLNSFIFAILKNFLKYLALVFLRAEISSECVSVGINTEILTNLQALGRDKAWNHYWNSEKSGKVFSHLQKQVFCNSKSFFIFGVAGANFLMNRSLVKSLQLSWINWIHSFPMYPFSNPWKHQKSVRFSDVFKG